MTSIRAASSSAPEMREMDPSTSSSSRSVASTASQASTSARIAPLSYRVSFFDAMKFTGNAPERVNSRLAMLMFFFAAQREHLTGETLLQQLQNPDWRVGILAALVVYATMVPVLKGVKDEDFFMFTVQAEKANGRFAMLGWVGLLLVEELYAHASFF